MTTSDLELALCCVPEGVCALHGHERSQQFLKFQATGVAGKFGELQTFYVAGKLGVSYSYFNRKPAISGNLELFLYPLKLAFLISNEAGKFGVSYSTASRQIWSNCLCSR